MTAAKTDRGRVLATAQEPRWLEELLAILDERRVTVMRTALGIVLGAAALSILFPDVLRPSFLVGLLVGVAAAALAAAIAFGMDAAESVVRGPRHVRAASAGLLSSGRNLERTAADLAAHYDGTLGDQVVHVGVCSPGGTTSTGGALVLELARQLASSDRRVVVTDLRGPGNGSGVADVVFGRVSLAEAVTFEEGVTVARIGAGAELDESLRAHATFLQHLPSDIDLSFVMLPSPVPGDGAAVVRGLDHVLVIAEQGGTRRLDLITTLDGLRTTGVQAHVVLVEPARAGSDAPRVPLLVTSREEAEELVRRRELEAQAEAARREAELEAQRQAAPARGPGTASVASAEVSDGDEIWGASDPDRTPEPDRAPWAPPPAPWEDEQGDVDPTGPIGTAAPAPPSHPIDPVDTTDATDRDEAEDAAPVVEGRDTDPDLDPDLIAEALATGELDLGDADEPDGPDTTPPPAQAAPPPSMADTQPIRLDIDPVRGTFDAPAVLEPAPLAPAPDVTEEIRARPLGDSDLDDDPLGMTAALHTFASERLGRDEDDTP